MSFHEWLKSRVYHSPDNSKCWDLLMYQGLSTHSNSWFCHQVSLLTYNKLFKKSLLTYMWLRTKGSTPSIVYQTVENSRFGNSLNSRFIQLIAQQSTRCLLQRLSAYNSRIWQVSPILERNLSWVCQLEDNSTHLPINSLIFLLVP